MTRQEFYNLLVKVKRPFELFGEISDSSELKRKYKEFVKKIHPDNASESDKYISEQGFFLLFQLYNEGKKELQSGIYGIVEPSKLYRMQEPLFSVGKKNKYDFYEYLEEGELSDIYRGLYQNDVIVLKLAVNESDNELLKSEYDTLSSYSHTSLPIVRKFIEINGLSAIIMDEIEGEKLTDIMSRNQKGIPAEHVAWIMERLFSVIGYLHSKYIIHSNIIPENIIINRDNHNVILTGFSFHISNANKSDKHYQVKNEKFSAPEITSKMEPIPSTDIYSLGKLAIYMLGGSLIRNAMPVNVPAEMRELIRKMVSEEVYKRPNDAWKLWDEWILMRNNVFGNKRFVVADF